VPNQIAYFNVFAGSDPAYIASDSDFDWGQDMLAMERYVRAHPQQDLYVSLNATGRVARHHLPAFKPVPPYPVTGWVAISERLYRINKDGWIDWLQQHEPVAIIGKTIRLYNIVDGDDFYISRSPASSDP
jgi:hypothetical protein